MRESGDRDKAERSERTLLDARTMHFRSAACQARRQWPLAALSVIERDRDACSGPARDGCRERKREKRPHRSFLSWRCGRRARGGSAAVTPAKSHHARPANIHRMERLRPSSKGAPQTLVWVLLGSAFEADRPALSDWRDRNGELEDRATWRIGARPQSSAVSLDDRATDRQSQAQSVGLRRVEGGEQVLLNFRR